ncbi:PREDICTED: uncharacterized protein LOC104589789 [Nelumbo nucifera]|uniref:Uncharacterized protein LOC104589789 n=1 Tax=Nelumbo nucifera TaxID=4432 RepID=A0A1U7Z0L8_NELNU|nr:PREDICTED: uncharacterized protein LOC104589789 [Nelumbo nucifera]
MAIDQLLSSLSSIFPLKDLGLLHYVLGIEARFTANCLVLFQEWYILDLFTRTKLDGAKPVSSPMVASSKLSCDFGTPLSDPSEYRSIVGALQYVTIMRSDISFAVNKFCQFIHSPTDEHCYSPIQTLGREVFKLVKNLGSVAQDSLEWKRKYEKIFSKQKAEDQSSAEIETLKSRTSAAEARLVVAREQAEAQSAQEAVEEWKWKYDVAVRETKAALEKSAIVQERKNKQTQLTEDSLREEYSAILDEKE